MENKMFADIPAEKREEALKANCLFPEDRDIQRYFNQEQMTQMRADLSVNLIHISKEDEKLEKAKQEYKTNTKKQYDENEGLTKNLRYGFQEVTTQLYAFPDWENGYIAYYDNLGDKQDERRMRPEERQMQVPK